MSLSLTFYCVFTFYCILSVVHLPKGSLYEQTLPCGESTPEASENHGDHMTRHLTWTLLTPSTSHSAYSSNRISDRKGEK